VAALVAALAVRHDIIGLHIAEGQRMHACEPGAMLAMVQRAYASAIRQAQWEARQAMARGDWEQAAAHSERTILLEDRLARFETGFAQLRREPAAEARAR
jgi:hypothetical protein